MVSKLVKIFVVFYLVQVVLSAFVLNTIAGTGSGASNGDNGAPTSAGVYGPRGMAVDKTRNMLYIAEFYGHKIRAVNLATNIITTVVGTGTLGSSGNGTIQCFIFLYIY